MKECIEDANSEKTSIEALINSITRENEKFQDEVDALRRKQASQRAADQEELENMAAKDKFREREICNLRNDLQRKESQIEEIRRECETVLAREEAMVFSVGEAKAKCDKSQEQLKQMKLYIVDLEQNTENLEKQVVENRTFLEHKDNRTRIHMPNNELPERCKNNILARQIIEDEEHGRSIQKPYDADGEIGRQTSEHTSLQTYLSPQRFHCREAAIESTDTLGCFRNKVFILESENRKMKQETRRLRKAVEENETLQYVDVYPTEGKYRPDTASLNGQDVSNSDHCAALGHIKGCYSFPPNETKLVFDQARTVCGRLEARNGVLNDWAVNMNDDLDKEWSLIKEVKDENLEASRLLTKLQVENQTLKLSDGESRKEDNVDVEAYSETLCSTVMNHRHETEQASNALSTHHVQLLQTDLDNAREELLQKNKEVCELKMSATLFEMKLREKELIEQEFRSNIKQLSNRYHDLEQDMSLLRRSTPRSITQCFSGKLF